MKHPNEPQREDAWLTVAELARALDIGTAAAGKILNYVPDKWKRPGNPKKGIATRVYGRGTIRLWCERQGGGAADLDEAELMAGGSSPALERFRSARADLAEREVAVRDGTLVLRDQMQRLLQGASAILRRQGDLLVRRCGNDAGEILQEGIDDLEKLIESEGFGTHA